MSNVEENAFQIARYLLENYQEDEQVAIRDALELSQEDFGRALKFLVDDECCSTYGRWGEKEAGIRRNPPKLQEFVNKISERRVLLSRDAERLLKYISTDQTPDFPFSLAKPIMEHFKWDENHYMQIAQELCDNDLVRGDYADGNSYFKLSLLPDGRKIVRNNFRLTSSLPSSFQVVGSNNVVNINSTLNSVHQFIQANSTVEPSSKEKLENLLRELESALKEVPEEKGNEAEAVAEMAKSLIENATKEKPNESLVEIFIDGLKKAAGTIADITPKVLLTAQAIIVFIKTLSP